MRQNKRIYIYYNGQHALIASHLDYCNSVLYQINTAATKTLQPVSLCHATNNAEVKV